MKYLHQPKVLESIAEKSKSDIVAVNNYVDNLKGTVITIETIRHGQAGAYQDSFYEAKIFCHSPNVYTTNGPLIRTINEQQAKTLARIFVSDWSDEPKFLASRLSFIRPLPNPCGLAEYSAEIGSESVSGEIRSSCWHVLVISPYND